MLRQIVEKHRDFRVNGSTGSFSNGQSTTIEWLDVHRVSCRHLIRSQIAQSCRQVGATRPQSLLPTREHSARDRNRFAKAALLRKERSPVFENGECTWMIL